MLGSEQNLNLCMSDLWLQSNQSSRGLVTDVQAVLDITGGVVSDPMLFKSVLLQELDEQSRVLKVILRQCSCLFVSAEHQSSHMP